MDKQKSASKVSRCLGVMALFAIFSLALPTLLMSCNDYPLRHLSASPDAIVTDTPTRNASGKVDILFVVDNSGSMSEEQAKLDRNFQAFISALLNEEIGDFQIGVVSTDMSDPRHSGRLLAASGQPKIIQGSQLSKAQIIQAFSQNVKVGIDGTSYEKPLDAMKAALSPALLDDPKANKGFLRPQSILSVIFVGDEDDCSHNGKIPEAEVDSEVCRLPKDQILKDAAGQPVLDHNNQPITGRMHELTPTSAYIEVLNALKARGHTLSISGLIGDPIVYKDRNKQIPIDPAGGCRNNIECTLGTEPHRCGYSSQTARQCGGCKSSDADAVPGFRIYEVIKAFGGGTSQWFPICGDDEGFNDALLEFAKAIVAQAKFFILSSVPSPKNTLFVRIVQPDGTTIVIPEAPSTGQRCNADRDCGVDFVCGSGDVCAGDGWVYSEIPVQGGQQARIRFSGKAKRDMIPGSKAKISYLTK